MPNKAQLWQGLIVILQYSLLTLLYYFIYQVVKTMRQDGAVRSLPIKSPAPSVQLTVVAVGEHSGLTVGQQFIVAETLTIGRGGHSDIIIADSFVSTEHACVARYQDGFALTDLGSTNGTLLNGERISEKTGLQSGDCIQIGSVILQLER